MANVRAILVSFVVLIGSLAHASEKPCEPHLRTGEDAFAVVTLRNNAHMPRVLAEAKFEALRLWVDGTPVGFAELFKRARDPNHPLAREAIRLLCELGLSDEHGNLDDQSREVILSAAEVNGDTVTLVSPFPPAD